RGFHVTGVQTCALPILLDRANAWLAAQPAREQRRWVRAVQEQRLEFLGMVDFFGRHPELKVPRVLAPITAHYSWSKGLKLLGLEIGRASCRERVYFAGL